MRVGRDTAGPSGRQQAPRPGLKEALPTAGLCVAVVVVVGHTRLANRAARILLADTVGPLAARESLAAGDTHPAVRDTPAAEGSRQLDRLAATLWMRSRFQSLMVSHGITIIATGYVNAVRLGTSYESHTYSEAS